MGECPDTPQSTSESTTTTTTNAGDTGQKFWEFADLGFDTGKNLWFIQFYNGTNENVGTYFAKSLSLDGGRATQYQWKDAQGGPFWHVRERFFATEIEKFSIDPVGAAMKLNFRYEGPGDDRAVPTEFSYILYAFHLSSKEEGRAPMGFVEFYDSRGDLIKRIDNRWIIIEGLNRKTSGEFPQIRLRAEGKDVAEITVTRTAIVIQGRPPAEPGTSDR
jgi:hypothetical protein